MICQELSHYNLDIVALSETRLAGDGSLQESNSSYIIFYKGHLENVHHDSGVGFAIKSKLVSDMSELSHGVYDRLMTLHFQLLLCCFIMMITVYAPTLASSEAYIIRFYSDLREILRKNPQG